MDSDKNSTSGNYPLATKEWAIKTAQEHFGAEKLTFSNWWSNGKGCSLGCFIQSDKYVVAKAVRVFKLPHWILALHEKIYEGSKDRSWHVRFFEAIPAGITNEQLQDVYHATSARRMSRLLELPLDENVKAAIERVKKLHEARSTGKGEWRKATKIAASAATYATAAAYATAANATYDANAANAANATYDAYAVAANYAAHAVAGAAIQNNGYADAARELHWQREASSLIDALAQARRLK